VGTAPSSRRRDVPEYVQWALVGLGILVLGWFASGRRSSDDEDEDVATGDARPRRRRPRRRRRWRPTQRHPLSAGTQRRRALPAAAKGSTVPAARARPPRPRLKRVAGAAPSQQLPVPVRSVSWSVGGSIPGFVVAREADVEPRTGTRSDGLDDGISWREV
jgi:hypothetical protein